MPHIQEALSQRIRSLQSELQAVTDDQGRAFRYRWVNGKAIFEREVLALHRSLRRGLIAYLLDSRILAIVSAPIIYLGVIPFTLLDVFLALFKPSAFQFTEFQR